MSRTRHAERDGYLLRNVLRLGGAQVAVAVDIEAVEEIGRTGEFTAGDIAITVTVHGAKPGRAWPLGGAQHRGRMATAHGHEQMPRQLAGVESAIDDTASV